MNGGSQVVQAKPFIEPAHSTFDPNLWCAFNALPDCVHIFDTDGYLLFVNEAGIDALDATATSSLLAPRRAETGRNIGAMHGLFTIAAIVIVELSVVPPMTLRCMLISAIVLLAILAGGLALHLAVDQAARHALTYCCPNRFGLKVSTRVTEVEADA